ncbi:ARM repeat-containing protein [Fragilariopsis cylindrus CCMP1102]|uniref:ARM repeat-containing protein n=1 Tax=Fragilariopsis cylindrus CCMP1102 TaxID=635003 RepID=A0A1E7EXR9_9STRA|nr:ARM repeat-containing protein [Fragilariopsis cylindrus CCMP1102]|eukprot:OEU10647.1 ARM repeat-containing protein [Fragilariopsis cylindrus CCMP1102]
MMVKSILNKMTKEKFDRLSQQIIDIPVKSYQILTMMIANVYEKAIDEPYLGDMYGNLCVRMSQHVQKCTSDANKQNSFKRSLLNKCEDEFNKQDIYVDFKKEKVAYEESKGSMSAKEQKEKEDDMKFRRMKIKKQMLGNVKFIGQLYKKSLLKEKIMRFCIADLLNLETKDVRSKLPIYYDAGDGEMDEEDHEAICNMFATIGKTIDKPATLGFIKICFDKIKKLSFNDSLPARSRFMYKDLLDLRSNNWVTRRKEEKAMTLDEIRKDVEQEERQQAQEAAAMHQGGGNYRGNNNYGGRGGGGRGGSGDYRSNNNNRGGNYGNNNSKTFPPLDKDKFARRVKSIRSEYMQDPKDMKELMLSVDELTGTDDHGSQFVSQNADTMVDCKEDERKAIYLLLEILVKEGKLSSSDVKAGLVDAIEFINSFVCDAPMAFDYLGRMLATMIRCDAIDVTWIGEQAEKTKAESPVIPEKIIRAIIKAIKADNGIDAVKNAFGPQQMAMETLLGKDQWVLIKAEMTS